MKYLSALLITSSVLLSACVSTNPTAQHGGGHTQGSPQQTKNLVVADQSTNTEIAFAIRDDEELLNDYGVSHTKEMHLIVVRDDLQHFSHLHPTRDANGVWRIPYAAPAGGNYWIYADFIESNEAPHTIRFERTYSGDAGAVGINVNSETVKVVDGYRIALETQKTAENVSFTYKITDAEGRPVELEEYLGARGHSVLISPTGEFIHAHASEDGADPVFTTSMLDDFYRAFTQFQIDGKVVTVNFDWQEQ